MVLEIKGDIRDTPIKNIAHGVNCQGVMGSGVARALFEKWPKVREEYLRFHENGKSRGLESKDFLGKNQYISITKLFDGVGYNIPEKQVINMHTQLNFGSGDKQYVDYASIMMCFNDLFDVEAVAVPKIGAGLAGGDWSIIKKIMVETTQKKGIDLVIYSLDK